MVKLNLKESDIAIEDYIYALQQKNLVYNSDFRYFSNADTTDLQSIQYGIADGWVFQDPENEGSAYFDSTRNQFVIMTGIDNNLVTLSQAIHEFPRWQKYLHTKIVTAKVQLNLETAGRVTVTLTDGISANSVTKSRIGNHEIEVQIRINQKAESLHIQISSDVAGTQVNISNVCANVGDIALEHLPCIVKGVIGERKQYIATENAPAEELSLCETPIELEEKYSRLNSVLNGRFGVGSNGRSMLINMGGYFSRAWDNTAQIDPDATNRTSPGTGTITGNHVSTIQQDAFLRHTHGLDFTVNTGVFLLGGDKSPNSSQVTTTTSETDFEPISEEEGKETRSKNIYELYTIKWA